MPDPGDQQRIGFQAIQDPVPVGPTGGREPGVEIVRGPMDGGQHHGGSDPPVHDVAQRLELGIRTLREVEAHHLSHGVHAAVRATGTRQGHLGP